jgi:ubiquinone/menaquinone biosynthesis C-methylase UbiE
MDILVMNLLDIIHRQEIPEPWSEGEKIPWDDPKFSRRMLREHLSQDHDAASRRIPIIDQHVRWIHEEILSSKPSKVLDLGCGPGLYTSRLSRLGHECVGIDFSPASITYAIDETRRDNLSCAYVLGDIRQTNFGKGYDLVMMIFGEFNVFHSSDANLVLKKVYNALKPDSHILLEAHTFDAVQNIGSRGSTWYSAESGLFSETPYICLEEHIWNNHIATIRYYIIDAVTGDVTRHASSMQSYTEKEYQTMITKIGFDEVVFYPSMQGKLDENQSYLFVIHARNLTKDQ